MRYAAILFALACLIPELLPALARGQLPSDDTFSRATYCFGVLESMKSQLDAERPNLHAANCDTV
jgi:hypothetical protein